MACPEKNQTLKYENLQNETPNNFAEKSMPSPLLNGLCHLLYYMVSRHTFWRSFPFDISLITSFLLNHFNSVMKWIVKGLINPFLPNIPFWSPWEHEEVFWWRVTLLKKTLTQVFSYKIFETFAQTLGCYFLHLRILSPNGTMPFTLDQTSLNEIKLNWLEFSKISWFLFLSKASKEPVCFLNY